MTAKAGIHFVHDNGGSGRRYYVETMCGGCAFLDYDGDGWQDILLIQEAPLPGYKASRPLRSALYHNNRNGTFTDVTKGSGLDFEMYGFAPAIGDYDNDGRPDIFITTLGGNRLFHNEGHGKFRDVAAKAGLKGKDWCTGASWLDYDRDGRLDLFVCRYSDYSIGKDLTCTPGRPRSFYCHPSTYKPAQSLLYHNNGNGTFTDVSQKSGIDRLNGRSLGVVCADLNDDGLIDILVTNDMTYNSLYLNNGNGTFRTDAATGLNIEGKVGAFAGMGVDCGDYQNDGRLDIAVTNFEREPVSLYRNSGGGTFLNETDTSRMKLAGSTYLKWGMHFVDLDLDGFQDLFIVNGHVQDRADERPDELGYAQPCQVFRNEGGDFTDVSSESGNFFAQREVGRGAAFGDYDNDGDSDVLIACNNSPAILLRNDSPHTHHWVRLALEGSARGMEGKGCNRDALGVRVQVRANGILQTQVVRSGTSYMADHDRRLNFGIGQDKQAKVEITWPCGAVQKLTAKAGVTTVVKENGCRLTGHNPKTS